METILVVIDDETGEELLKTDFPFADVTEKVGGLFYIEEDSYTIVDIDSEPKLNKDCDVVGTYLIFKVKSNC